MVCVTSLSCFTVEKNKWISLSWQQMKRREYSLGDLVYPSPFITNSSYLLLLFLISLTGGVIAEAE